MPPDSDGEVRTVGCAFERLVPDAEHRRIICDAVSVVHKTTILATELLNMHLRRVLRDNPTADLSCFFSSNWLLNACNEVTSGKGRPSIVAELRSTRDQFMPPFEPPDRRGLTQCLMYSMRNLAATAATNVWMHFQKRVLAHVRLAFALDDATYAALSKGLRQDRKRELMQMAADICRIPSAELQSPDKHHAWVASERARLGIDDAVGDWANKPLLFHLKKAPHRFVRAMLLMSLDRERGGRGAYALYPLRHINVPRHARFDQKVLRELLELGSSAYTRERAKAKRKHKDEPVALAEADDDLGTLPPLRSTVGADNSTTDAPWPPALVSESVTDAPSKSGRNRRSRNELRDEKAELFGKVVDLHAAGVRCRNRFEFDFAFTTDGVCARVQMRKLAAAPAAYPNEGMPRRGIWAIDQLKHLARVEDIHAIGVDPGKRELIVGVSTDRPRDTPVRYTQRQRMRETRTQQYAAREKRLVTDEIRKAQASLAGFNSRTADLSAFCAFCAKRHEALDATLECYANMEHRRMRWKKVIKTQQSEERLYKRLEALQTDARPLVLAYGSWGLVAGRAGAACNRGNPPCIGVGLMRKLARRFVVVPTPEAYTSKTCCKCLEACGPWAEIEMQRGKSVRGLRRCTQRDCMMPLNRDRNAAVNIGTNFVRLMQGGCPIRSMTQEDLTFHRASMCLECGV